MVDEDRARIALADKIPAVAIRTAIQLSCAEGHHQITPAVREAYRKRGARANGGAPAVAIKRRHDLAAPSRPPRLRRSQRRRRSSSSTTAGQYHNADRAHDHNPEGGHEHRIPRRSSSRRLRAGSVLIRPERHAPHDLVHHANPPAVAEEARALRAALSGAVLARGPGLALREGNIRRTFPSEATGVAALGMALRQRHAERAAALGRRVRRQRAPAVAADVGRRSPPLPQRRSAGGKPYERLIVAPGLSPLSSISTANGRSINCGEASPPCPPRRSASSKPAGGYRPVINSAGAAGLTAALFFFAGARRSEIPSSGAPDEGGCHFR